MNKNLKSLFSQAINFQEQGKLTEAEPLLQKILTKAPTNYLALYSMAVLMLKTNRFEQALKLTLKGTVIAPGYAPLWFLQGELHVALFERDKALSDYEQALKLNPTYLEVLINSGALLRDMSRFKEAIIRFKMAVDANPKSEMALINYGVLLIDFKMHSEAIEVFKDLLAINPDYPFCIGLMSYERMYLCDWTDLSSTTELITKGIREGKKVSRTLGYMSLSDSAEDHYSCANIFAKTYHHTIYPPLWTGEVYQHQKIKIAYVSPDFREHPVGHLIAGVIEKHNKDLFEIILISIGIDDKSTLRRRFAEAADHFIDAKEMSVAQIAVLMRQMEVDIAIDLAGYTSDSRTQIFSHRPAPVQVNYLGYPGSMALDCYDYIIADRIVIPPEEAVFYSEKPAYLDYCYLPIATGVEIAEPKTRKEYGLPDQGFIFCAFSHDYKIHPDIFFQWVRLLKENPESVLWLMSRSEQSVANLRKQAELAGVTPERLVFAYRVPSIQDHLARYKVANLFLDTWPYNAHTTCADALLAGLPVVTYKGTSFPSRVAASLVTAVGLEALVTTSHEEYFQLANRLAKENALLNHYRQFITAKKIANHPFLGSSFTRRIEKIFLDISGNIKPEKQVTVGMLEYQKALLHFQKSNYTISEFHVRDCLKLEPENPHALALLEKLKNKFSISNQFVLSENKTPVGDDRYLLIKAWGCGFWSDVHHIITQLLLAELTQRKPVVLWGTNSIYRHEEDDAFPLYFKTNRFAGFHEISANASFFPQKWSADNLLVENNNKWSGPESRLSAQYFFDRNETVLVSDFYSPIDTMKPWIDANSSYYGMSEDQIFAILFKNYLMPVDRIQKSVEDFYQQNMKSRNWVAVHMRGTDKINESPHLNETNLKYHEFLDRILHLNPSLGIFLMTDSETILNSMVSKYGDKIITMKVQRSSTTTGIHFSGHSGHLIGDEILTETYLATKCDYFIGNMESNVSLAIFSLKDWVKGFVFLLGVSSARGRNSLIFKNN